MIYVYDILLNFNKELIEFFEWEKHDNIKYAKKISLFKVDKKVIKDILEYEIEFDSSFVKNTNKYDFDGIGDKIYYTLLTDGDIVIGLSIKNNKIDLLSRLIIDEEDEVITMANSINKYNINYKKLGLKRKDSRVLTRNEKEKLKGLKKEIINLYKDKNYDKLKYLYYEFTSKYSDNIKFIYENLLNSFNSYNKNHDRLIKVLKLSGKKM